MSLRVLIVNSVNQCIPMHWIFCLDFRKKITDGVFHVKNKFVITYDAVKAIGMAKIMQHL